MANMQRTNPTPAREQLRLALALLRARVVRDEAGATAIEYALIASGIGAALAATVYSLGSTTQGLYSRIASLF
jgi:pilus assembly protein Flp/PilA